MICAARSADLVKETAAQVTAAKGRAIAIACDAAKEDEVRQMAEKCVDDIARLILKGN